MPFKSEAQRRKFYALKAKGRMDQKTIDEWEANTPDEIPEKVAALLRGFAAKLAEVQGRRGIFNRKADRSDIQQGLMGNHDDTMADPELRDTVRGVRSFHPFETGGEMQDAATPHIRY